MLLINENGSVNGIQLKFPHNSAHCFCFSWFFPAFVFLCLMFSFLFSPNFTHIEGQVRFWITHTIPFVCKHTASFDTIIHLFIYKQFVQIEFLAPINFNELCVLRTRTVYEFRLFTHAISPVFNAIEWKTETQNTNTRTSFAFSLFNIGFVNC